MKKLFDRPGRGWEGNTELNFKETSKGCGHTGSDRVQLKVLFFCSVAKYSVFISFSYDLL